MGRKFYKTTVTVVVLSDENDVSELDLAELAEAVDIGPYVGTAPQYQVQQVTEEEMSVLLLGAGSDPSFFQIGVEEGCE